MNGRVYDPTTGRFLSADPNIFHPFETQNFNRYTYVMNNPLKYTDPSGFDLAGSGCGDDGEGNDSEDDSGGYGGTNTSSSTNSSESSGSSWGDRISSFFGGLFGGSKTNSQGSVDNGGIHGSVDLGTIEVNAANVGGYVSVSAKAPDTTPTDSISGLFGDERDSGRESSSGLNSRPSQSVSSKLGELETDNTNEIDKEKLYSALGPVTVAVLQAIDVDITKVLGKVVGKATNVRDIINGEDKVKASLVVGAGAVGGYLGSKISQDPVKKAIFGAVSSILAGELMSKVYDSIMEKEKNE